MNSSATANTGTPEGSKPGRRERGFYYADPVAGFVANVPLDFRNLRARTMSFEAILSQILASRHDAVRDEFDLDI